jgi:hypothetical protein
MSQRFLNALKAKYKTPRAAMAALGLDMALLRADPSQHEEEASSMRGGRFDPRGHTGGEIVRDDIPSPQERRVSPLQNEDEGAPIERPASLQRMSAEDDERDEYADFADYLRERGIAEDVIRGAVDYHRRKRGMDNWKSNGHDRREARDRFPQRKPAGRSRR